METKNSPHGTITDNNHAALWHGRFAEGPDAAAVEFAAGFERCITDSGKSADKYMGSLYPEFYGEYYQGLSKRVNKAMNYYLRFNE